MNAGQNIYVATGGQGSCGWVNDSSSTYRLNSGFNGGGYSFAGAGGDGSNKSCTGGGATHIATKSGELYQLENYKNDILIVSGGGGGMGPDDDRAGAGGGTYGGNGSGTGKCNGNGGTQSGLRTDNNCKPISVKCFGRATSTSLMGGSGGGGYYGGDGGASDNVEAYNTSNYACTPFSGYKYTVNPWSAGGGGGSGYLNPALKNASFYVYTTAGGNNTNIVSTYDSHVSKKPNTGNGYARITYLGTSI